MIYSMSVQQDTTLCLKNHTTSIYFCSQQLTKLESKRPGEEREQPHKSILSSEGIEKANMAADNLIKFLLKRFL